MKTIAIELDAINYLGVKQLRQVARELQGKACRLQAIIDKLPKCWRLDQSGKLVQDVPIVPEMKVWLRWSELSELITEYNVFSAGRVCFLDGPDGEEQTVEPEECYSTYKAAKAAGGG